MDKEQLDAILFLRDLKKEAEPEFERLERFVGESPKVRDYLDSLKEANVITDAGKKFMEHGKDFGKRVAFGGLTGAGIGTIRATGDQSNPLETPSDKLKRFGKSALEGGVYGSTIGGGSKLVELGSLRNKIAFLNKLKPALNLALSKGVGVAKANPNLSTTLGGGGVGAVVGGMADGSLEGAGWGALGGASLGAAGSFGRKAIPKQLSSTSTQKALPSANPLFANNEAKMMAQVNPIKQKFNQGQIGQSINKEVLNSPESKYMYNGAGLEMKGPAQKSIYSRGEHPMADLENQVINSNYNKSSKGFDGSYSLNDRGIGYSTPLSTQRTSSSIKPNIQRPELAKELQKIKAAFLGATIGKALNSPIAQGAKNMLKTPIGMNAAVGAGIGATSSGLSGGNPLTGAAIGGVGAGIGTKAMMSGMGKKMLQPGKITNPSRTLPAQSAINPVIQQPR